MMIFGVGMAAIKCFSPDTGRMEHCWRRERTTLAFTWYRCCGCGRTKRRRRPGALAKQEYHALKHLEAINSSPVLVRLSDVGVQ